MLEINKDTIKVLLLNNIDSGQLILVDPSIRQVGKSRALIEVSQETGIPIFAKRDQAFLLNRLAEETVAWSTEADIIAAGQFSGFLVDEGVSLQEISNLNNLIFPVSASFRLRTGLYTNNIFNREFIANDPV